MNCHACGRLLYANQVTCPCGAKNKQKQTLVLPSQQAAWLSNRIQRAFAQRLAEVSVYVAKRQAEHPGATKHDACIVYLREKNLMSHLPKHLLSEEEREAQLERDAIAADGRAA